MNNKKTKRVISWELPKGGAADFGKQGNRELEPRFYIDGEEVTEYEFHGLEEYVDADVPTLEALLEKTEKEEPACSLKFTQEWKPKMILIRKLIRLRKLDAVSSTGKSNPHHRGPYMGIDENGFPNIFF